jgi:esterase/lipase superfamily enzyme
MPVMELTADIFVTHEQVSPYEILPLLRLAHDPDDAVRAAATDTLNLLSLPPAIRDNIRQLAGRIETSDQPGELPFEPYESKAPLDFDEWLRSICELNLSGDKQHLDRRLIVESVASSLQASTASTTGSDSDERIAVLADSYLQRVSEEFSLPTDEELEALKTDLVRASAAVTALFLHLLKETKEQDHGYMVGNEVVRLVAALGPKFVPDVAALFEIYLQMHPEIQSDREHWYRTKDDNIIFFGTPYLAASWQLAWTISRAGAKDALAGVATGFVSPNARERLAAVNLVEDTLKYAQIDYVPLFGGGTGPSDLEVQDGTMEVWTDLTRGSLDYKVMTVFYGTDRNATGNKKPTSYYGGDRGERLELGVCKVSIPQKKAHSTGELETPSIWKLELREDPAKHVVLLTVEPYGSQDAFTSALKTAVEASPGKQAIVFVHGYRVTFEDAARRTAQLAYDLGVEEAPIIPIFYSWPSQGKFLSYGADQENADNAKPYLEKFLTLVAGVSGATTIHLIAHSMGNQGLTEVLQQSTTLSGPVGKPLFKEIILTAPDIDAGVFKKQIAPRIQGKGKRITLYASSRDRALLAAKILRRGYQRAGDANPILVTTGIHTIDASAVDTSFLGHSYFSDNRSVVSDIAYLVQHDLDPGRRVGMALKKHPDGQYWVFRP